MTRVLSYIRNEKARETIASVLLDALKAPPPISLSVTARDDHSGEPAIYVYVEMPSEKDIPKISTRTQLVADMLSALEQIDDDRFPYLHFGPRQDDPDDDDSGSGSDDD